MINKRAKIQKEAVDSILRGSFNGSLLVSQRVGKTKIVIDSLKFFLKTHKKYKVLWVTPSTKLRDEDIPSEFIKWKAKSLLRRVNIVCWASLNKEDMPKYNLVILDEVQKISIGNSSKLVKNRPEYVLGMTGTYPEDEEKVNVLKNLGLDRVLYDYSLNNAVEDKILADYQANVIYFPLNSKDKELVVKTKKAEFKTTEKKRYEYFRNTINAIRYSGKDAFFMQLAKQRFLHTLPRKEQIVKELLNNKLKNKKTLIFCSTKAQAERLCKNVFHSTSGDKAYNQFQKDEIKHLAVVNIVSMGYTFQNMDAAILLTPNNNKNGLFSQKASRIFIRRDNYIAQLYIPVAIDTSEEKWVKGSLKQLSDNKIKNIYWKDIIKN